MYIVVILPCRGRKEQTLDVVQRLLATSGLQYGVDWKLVLVSGTDDADIVESVASQCNVSGVVDSAPRLSYWEALHVGSQEHKASLYVCVANDVLPCINWLAIAHKKMLDTFSDGVGIVGFNGDGHGESHSCHFMISEVLLEWYGGWPVWYHHNFGDTELITRARQEGRYVKSPWAILFHDHPWIAAKEDDHVYSEGRSQANTDGMLFTLRKANGWKH